MAEEGCACGQPLHYSDPDLQRNVEDYIRQLGPTIVVEAWPGERWRVPRHYIALHGLRAAEVPALAERFGWERA